MTEHDFVQAEVFPTETAAMVAAAFLDARGIRCVMNVRTRLVRRR